MYKKEFMNKHEAEQESASETGIRMCGWVLLKMAEEKRSYGN
jgi:hypothetical protein